MIQQKVNLQKIKITQEFYLNSLDPFYALHLSGTNYYWIFNLKQQSKFLVKLQKISTVDMSEEKIFNFLAGLQWKMFFEKNYRVLPESYIL